MIGKLTSVLHKLCLRPSKVIKKYSTTHTAYRRISRKLSDNRVGHTILHKGYLKRVTDLSTQQP